ncbi:acetyl-CoA carboxylase biotin carboxyl carrier protein [Ferroacidibacillus organovorans]|uniref:Biotin carboxyl carrier protein of acetyl-CoA carboxylase n=1 Tax=Ferroacidibacillus organovorans TaxID=1765683 RepID=A0A117SYD7_9BACL|nr:acetyl-CoA carboxylase biotin carboxyl carrier protein [Ferroacidibacillus organovorans]KUO96781.1 hypothetical protein ATW55_08140 [Ferroacidibacillus organovorans]
MIKVGDIRELIRLLDETSLHELQLEAGDVKLTLKKADMATPVVFSAQHVAHSAPPVQEVSIPAAPSQPVLEAPKERDPVAADPEAGTVLIKSPMVGTFYRSSSPNAAPYVDQGSRVTEKTVVCIVEAMKLMNEIEADVRGEIVEVLAENGQLVEFGQPLFRVKLA